MVNSDKLNTLALMAQRGCPESELDILLRFMPVIERISKTIRHLIDDEVAFEAYCYNLIKQAIRKYDESKGNLRWQIEIRLRDARRHFIKNRSKRRKIQVSYEFITGRTDVDEERKRTIEFEDVLADIESMVCERERLQEKIALLAKGDPKKTTILNAWLIGFDNDSELALLLAQQYGGKSESHRRTITRFRSYCQAVLAGSA
ncbi:hypothetical protein G3578_09835 [Brevibacillus sp. SYP-B805]|uniref:hypothetical protein n=1 Tax=Brevibacillus sp. SYP-B805 TaxID=1578199 RepID=UPI0013EBD8D6|nr:hypothetical protein [Brevibacillus sp. SYP-B805]NGQ95453.1 hypothetical protein [Brevibacillus sp. SYP-B805]